MRRVWPAAAPHRAAGRLVQPGAWRPSAYQPDGAEAPRPRRGVVAGLAAEPAEAGRRHGAVRRAARAGAAGRRRAIRASGSPTSRTRLGTRYTADTVTALDRRFPHDALRLADGRRQSGADCRTGSAGARSVRTVPIAVFDRPSLRSRALCGPAAQRFRPSPPAGRRGAPPGRDEAAGLGVFPYPARPELGDRIRAERATASSQTFERSKHPNCHDHRTARAPRRPAQRRRPRRAELLDDLVARRLDDGKAEDIVTIDLAGKTDIADYMVIASGRSARQVTALTEHLLEPRCADARASRSRARRRATGC